MKGFRLVLSYFVLSCCFSTSSNAATCETKSPQLIRAGDIDSYYSYTSGRPLSRIEQKTINRLARRLVKRFTGTLTEEFCAANNRIITANHEITDGNMSYDNGVLNYSYKFLSSTNGVTTQDSLMFLEPNSDYEVFHLDNDSLITNLKTRVPGKGVFSERVIKLSITRRTLDIELTTYFNGYYYSSLKFKIKNY